MNILDEVGNVFVDAFSKYGSLIYSLSIKRVTSDVFVTCRISSGYPYSSKKQ